MQGDTFTMALDLFLLIENHLKYFTDFLLHLNTPSFSQNID